jgi:hypothetical protein
LRRRRRIPVGTDQAPIAKQQSLKIAARLPLQWLCLVASNPTASRYEVVFTTPLFSALFDRKMVHEKVQVMRDMGSLE